MLLTGEVEFSALMVGVYTINATRIPWFSSKNETSKRAR